MKEFYHQHEIEYEIKRSDIDVNHHLHNINYLDLANEALPDDVYNNNKEFDNFRIFYKKEKRLSNIREPPCAVSIFSKFLELFIHQNCPENC